MLTRDLANKIGLLFILLDNFLKFELTAGDFRAQYILYLIFIAYYILVRRKIQIENVQLVNVLIIMTVLTLVPLIAGSNFVFYFKQALLITFSLCYAYLLINAYDFDFIKLFKDYIDLIYFASIVGVIQAVSLVLHFRYGADYSYLGFAMGNFEMTYVRIQSWFEEPAVMALAFLPVVFICLASIFRLTDMISIPKSIFITLMFLATQSSNGLVGFLIAVFIIVNAKYSFFKKPHIVIGGFVLLFIFGFAFYSIPLVKIRVDDTTALFVDPNVTVADIDKTNVSTYATFSNFRVAVASFIDHPLIGTGLGTHEFNYDHYITEVIPPSPIRSLYPLNKKDADSLLLRIISEGGLLGLVLSAWFLINNRIKLNLKTQSKEEVLYWVFNTSVLVLIFARFFRQGHYTSQGFMLFILVYIFTKKHVAQRTELFMA